uniref:MAP7 domain-containing protein 2 n=1 Tax=Strongyloides stercoralis TaxID=6248 RepID=A0A0K0E6H9_STRER
MENSGLMSASTYCKKNNAAEVLRRKQAAEKEQEMKLQKKIKEKEEKLKRATEMKNQDLREKTRKMHEKELLRQKMVLDRRAAQLEQDRTKKMEILTKAHAATSRLSSGKSNNVSPQHKKVYAFGSSTPRDLVYLEKLSREQKIYNNKLTAPPTTSGKLSQGPSHTPSPNKTLSKSNVAFGSSMTSSLYVPSTQKIHTITRSPLNPVPLRKGPSANTTPNRNVNIPPLPRRSTTKVSPSMTQSMYTPKPSVSVRSNTTLRSNGTPNGLQQHKPMVTSISNRNISKSPLLQKQQTPKKSQKINGEMKKDDIKISKPKEQDTVIKDTGEVHPSVIEEFHSVEKDVYLEKPQSIQEEEGVEEYVKCTSSLQVDFSIKEVTEVGVDNKETPEEVGIKDDNNDIGPPPIVPETLKLPEKTPVVDDEASPEPIGTSEENKFDSGVDSETPNDNEQISRNSIGVNSITSAIAQLSIRTPVSKKSPEQNSTLPHSSSSSSSSNEDLACIAQMKNEIKSRIQKEKEERDSRNARIQALLSKARGTTNSDSTTTTTNNSTKLPERTSTSPILLNNDKKLEDSTNALPTTSDLGISLSTAKTLEKIKKMKERNSGTSSATSTPVVEKSVAEELSSLGVNLPGQPNYDYPPEDPKVNGATFTSQTAASS